MVSPVISTNSIVCEPSFSDVWAWTTGVILSKQIAVPVKSMYLFMVVSFFDAKSVGCSLYSGTSDDR